MCVRDEEQRLVCLGPFSKLENFLERSEEGIARRKEMLIDSYRMVHRVNNDCRWDRTGPSRPTPAPAHTTALGVGSSLR